MNLFRSRQVRQVNLFVDKEDIEQLAIALTRLGTLRLIEDRQESSGGSWSSLSRRYRSLAQRVDDLLDALEIVRKEAPPPKELRPSRDIERMQDTVKEAQESVRHLQEREKAAQHAVERARLLVEEMKLLEPMNIPVERLRKLEHLHLTVGTIPVEEEAGLRASLFRITFVIIPVLEYDSRVLIFAASTGEHCAILDRALLSADFDPLRLPQEAAGHPEQLMDELQTRLADANDHLAAVKQERQHLAGRWEEELLELLRCAKADAEVADTISQFAHEGQAYLVRGQVSENALHDLLQKVEAVTKGKASIEGRL